MLVGMRTALNGSDQIGARAEQRAQRKRLAQSVTEEAIFKLTGNLQAAPVRCLTNGLGRRAAGGAAAADQLAADVCIQ